MKNKFLTTSLLFALLTFFTSCDNTSEQDYKYQNGIFVTNEGSFGSSNSELSFIKSDNSVYNNIYGASNNGLILGDVLQSMLIADGKAYLVVNNSNKIEVVNTTNLANEKTIGGLSLPRYMTIVNGTGYVTQWTNLGANGHILQINLSTGNITDSLELGNKPEQMLALGTNILVANSEDTTLHLVNTSTMTKTNIGQVDYPKQIVQTSDGNIWVLYTGKPAWSGTQTDGGLLVLNADATAIVKNITIGSTSTANPSYLTTDGTNLYYEYQGNIYKMASSATVAPSSPFIAAPAVYVYGLGYYSANNTLLIADAKNFSTSGVVRRYNAGTGALIDTLITGIAPNGFVFN